MLKIKTDNLEQLFEKISEASLLFAPVSNGNITDYSLWKKGDEVVLSSIKTEKSPKGLFFPQTENLAEFKTEGKKISIKSDFGEKQPFVIFGMRACDLKGMEILDKVFLAEPKDTFYESRRNAATIVTLACNEPEETCFCGVFGVEPYAPKGDVTAYLTDGYLYWSANTKKGEKLTDAVKSLMESADAKEVDGEIEKIKEITKKLPLNTLNPDVFKGKDEKEIFASENWDELYKGCLGCGTCTFVCPTCQCYDIRDYKSGDKVLRFRCWDSCMYSDFTKMAHGNPRTTQKERYRQRFMHKLVYFPLNNDGEFSCVGCGRCVRKCPVKTNIARVIKKFGGGNANV